MTREDIIRIYKEANGWSPDGYENTVDELERFAKLVRDDYSNKHANLWLDRCHAYMLAEREACAKLVDHILKEGGGTWGDAIRSRIGA